jgi:hypothetical protein
MTKDEFEALTLADKSEVIWQHGELISNKTDSIHIITLYSLFSFFVEFRCDKCFTKIEEIVTMNTLAHDRWSMAVGRL